MLGGLLFKGGCKHRLVAGNRISRVLAAEYWHGCSVALKGLTKQRWSQAGAEVESGIPRACVRAGSMVWDTWEVQQQPAWRKRLALLPKTAMLPLPSAAAPARSCSQLSLLPCRLNCRFLGSAAQPVAEGSRRA